MPPRIRPTLPTSTHAAGPSNQRSPSTSTFTAAPDSPRLRAPGPEVGRAGPAGPWPRRPRRGSSARRSPVPAITANASPLMTPTSIGRGMPLTATSTRLSRSIGTSTALASRLAVPGGQDRHLDLGVLGDDGVDAAPDRAVAAPHEQAIDAGVEQLAHLLGRLLALGNLAPIGLSDACIGERRAKRAWATAESLARVHNHADRHHRTPPAIRVDTPDGAEANGSEGTRADVSRVRQLAVSADARRMRHRRRSPRRRPPSARQRLGRLPRRSARAR